MTNHETLSQKALRLLDDGAILALTRLETGTRCIIQGDHGRYVVTLPRQGAPTCTCPWGRYHASDDHVCNHIRCALLSQRL